MYLNRYTLKNRKEAIRQKQRRSTPKGRRTTKLFLKNTKRADFVRKLSQNQPLNSIAPVQILSIAPNQRIASFSDAHGGCGDRI